MLLGRLVVWTVAALAVLYVAVCVLAFACQRSLMYFPRPNANRLGMSSVAIDVGGGVVSVLTREMPGDEALIYFGGNAEDVSLDMPELAPRYAGSIYLLNYPGYGDSHGRPSEQSLLHAAFALFDRVHATHPKVVVVGRSLGSGVAVRVAAERPVWRLVLVTPFASFADPAAAAYPYLPVRWLMRDRFESSRYAPQITAPTRILVAERDEIIPRASTERLRDSFRVGVATYVLLPNVGHNTISLASDYYRLLLAP
jgi:pimeloyl-ACP methyl ester carboxylesterase